MLTHSHPELTHFQYVVFVDSSRRFVDCSDDVLPMLGYSRGDFLTKTIDDISYSLEDVPVLFKDFISHGNQEGTYVLKQFSGAPLPIQYQAFVFSDGCKAAGWKPISDWRAVYLAAISQTDPEALGPEIDIALAAIYRKMYPEPPASALPDNERAVLADALSTLSSLRKNVSTVLSPEFLEFEKTRSALLRLSVNLRETDATRILYDENKSLIDSSIQKCFPAIDPTKIAPTLLDRIAHRARYYDPDADPKAWLQSTTHLECRRLNLESDSQRGV